MVFRRNPEGGRQAVAILATACVMLFGAVACCVIILSAAERPLIPALVLGGIFLMLITMLGLIGSRQEKNASRPWFLMWLSTRDRTNPLTMYRVGKKKPAEPVEYGNNGPPTLDSVREAADQNVAWVPHGPPPERSRDK